MEKDRFKDAPFYRREFEIGRYLVYFVNHFLVFCTAYIRAISKSYEDIEEVKEREDMILLNELA